MKICRQDDGTWSVTEITIEEYSAIGVAVEEAAGICLATPDRDDQEAHMTEVFARVFLEWQRGLR